LRLADRRGAFLFSPHVACPTDAMARLMSEHPQNDYLSRALARGQIDEDQEEIGRIWQVLFGKAQDGEEWASNILDAWWINAQAVQNFVSGRRQWDLDAIVKGEARGAAIYKELLRDVLGAPEPEPGLPSPLAQAAAKRGLNPTTGSRDMKRLGKIIRGCLIALSRSFDDLVPSFEERQRDHVRHYLEKRRFGGGAHVNLAGVKVSTSASDKIDAKIREVQELALSQGFKISPADKPGLFYMSTLRGIDVLPDDPASIVMIESVLLQIKAAPAAPQRRKRGARGRPQVTKPPLRSIVQDDARRLSEEIDEQRRRRKIEGARTSSARRLQTLARSKEEARKGGWENLLKSIGWVDTIR
jgi:hypothetical protein